MKMITKNNTLNNTLFLKEELPTVCILISVYNEAAMISKKIQNCFESTYPKGKIKVFIGSDGSTDETVAIAESLNLPHVFIHSFERMGKGNVLNKLFEISKQEAAFFYVLTDVNVIFKEATLFELIKHFKNNSIGLVSAWVHNIFSKQGVAEQENYYIQHENELKYAEGLWGGNVVGAFGAAYAIRPGIIEPIPYNFVTDDLYISTQIALKKFDCILESKSIVEEIVYPTEESEFKRKKRFSAGNFQVLFYHLFSFRNNLKYAFCFFSHKVIRWKIPFLLFFTPFFILMDGLETKSNQILLLITALAYLAPFWNKVLIKLGIENKLAKFAAYFISMNIAIGVGFINYIKGIESNVWQPTKRD